MTVVDEGWPDNDEAADLDIYMHRAVRNERDWDRACHTVSPTGRMRCVLSEGHLLGSFEQHVGFARDGTLRSWRPR